MSASDSIIDSESKFQGLCSFTGIWHVYIAFRHIIYHWKCLFLKGLEHIGVRVDISIGCKTQIPWNIKLPFPLQRIESWYLWISFWLSSHPAYFNQFTITPLFLRILSSNAFLFLNLYDASSASSEIFCFGGYKWKSQKDVGMSRF